MDGSGKNTWWMVGLLIVVVIVLGGIYGYTKYRVSYEQVAASCSAGQFCGGSVAPTAVAPGGSYTLSCNYGYAGNGIYAVPGSGSCTYQKFIGTTAIFNCTAGNTIGTFPNSCKLDTPTPYSHRTDPINTLKVGTCAPGQFCGGSAVPASTTAGGAYGISCDYGYVGNGIYAVPGSGYCTYTGFVGTAAQFACTAGNTSGTFNNSCKIGSPAPYSYRSDPINQTTVGGGNSLIPPYATGTFDLEHATNWAWEHDPGTPGNSTGTSAIVTSPVLPGSTSSRQYYFVYAGDGGERYHISFANDLAATHFVYDTWVYIADPKNIQNLELDMNQVLFLNGTSTTLIYGTQCSSISQTWEYTIENPLNKIKTKWIPSNISCNPQTWSPYTWHHVQIASERDSSGNVTYDWIDLDGKLSYFQGAKGPSAFALGWPKGLLLLNFQIDGEGAGSVTLNTDKFTIWRWQ